jgi:hypothetical protein
VKNQLIINTSNTICQGLSTKKEKMEAIYKYVNSFQYDYNKVLVSMSNPVFWDGAKYGALALLRDKKGICFDKACLVSALAQAQHIYCLVIFTKYDENGVELRHSYNKALVEDGKWIILDTTWGQWDKERPATETIYNRIV